MLLKKSKSFADQAGFYFTLCLGDELGMRGFSITDYYPSGGMSMTYGVMAGTDLPDGGDDVKNFKKFGPDVGGYGYYARACRQSAQRILYTVANSNAMDFIGMDTRYSAMIRNGIRQEMPS